MTLDNPEPLLMARYKPTRVSDVARLTNLNEYRIAL